MKPQRILLPFLVRAAAGTDRVLEFTASTEDVASDGLIVLASAWDLSRFVSAGAFLWAHNRSEDKPPIGVPVSAAVDPATKTLKATVRFAKAEDFPFADVVYRLYQDGIMRACSVGFRILEMRDAIPSEKLDGAWGVVTKAELYELSAVPVGADAGALVEGVRKAIAAGRLTSADRQPLELVTRGEGAWGEALRAFDVVRCPSQKPRADASANVDALKDLARSVRQAADMVDAIADDLVVADVGTKSHDEGAVRAAVEAATKPLEERIRGLELEKLTLQTRAAIAGAHA